MKAKLNRPDGLIPSFEAGTIVRLKENPLIVILCLGGESEKSGEFEGIVLHTGHEGKIDYKHRFHPMDKFEGMPEGESITLSN